MKGNDPKNLKWMAQDGRETKVAGLNGQNWKVFYSEPFTGKIKKITEFNLIKLPNKKRQFDSHYPAHSYCSKDYVIRKDIQKPEISYFDRSLFYRRSLRI